MLFDNIVSIKHVASLSVELLGSTFCQNLFVDVWWLYRCNCKHPMEGLVIWACKRVIITNFRRIHSFHRRIWLLLLDCAVAILVVVLVEFLDDILPTKVRDNLELLEKNPYLDERYGHVCSLSSHVWHENNHWYKLVWTYRDSLNVDMIQILFKFLIISPKMGHEYFVTFSCCFIVIQAESTDYHDLSFYFIGAVNFQSFCWIYIYLLCRVSCWLFYDLKIEIDLVVIYGSWDISLLSLQKWAVYCIKYKALFLKIINDFIGQGIAIVGPQNKLELFLELFETFYCFEPYDHNLWILSLLLSYTFHILVLELNTAYDSFEN